jgi:hypothetical protein
MVIHESVGADPGLGQAAREHVRSGDGLGQDGRMMPAVVQDRRFGAPRVVWASENVMAVRASIAQPPL